MEIEGYSFDIHSNYDKELLPFFVIGIAEGAKVNIEKPLASIALDCSNAVSHLVITVPVSLFFRPSTWPYIWNGSLTKEIEEFISLYDKVVGILAQSKCGNDEYKAKGRIGVLITEMHQITEGQRIRARNLILSKFRSTIPDSHTLFFDEGTSTLGEFDFKTDKEERLWATFLK